ncbi:hypothetical protein B0H15DRAFT_905113 [Mycena belliarum]|uniref:Fungal-type protein kinase domain-containing protein n=1 Tax=Mycena belliarum TaxID=1033014 RepID=A0AAD6UD89_9AGAR|nr:hypothetical protein B0H15DRAFT_905113 [Mycena belliae]
MDRNPRFRLRRSTPKNPDVFVSGVPQVPLEEFIVALLPAVSEASRAQLKERLVTRHPSPPHTSAVRKPSRNDPFKDLKILFDAAVEAATNASPDLSGTAELELLLACPSTDNSRPDAEFRVASHTTDALHPWMGTAIPWRYDPGGSSSYCNQQRIIWDCHNVLREDSRRRFTFGITVDTNDFRIWFFSRSHNVVSEPHNLTTEPDILIRLFLSIASATPESLGYDPTTSYFVDDTGTIQYKLGLNDAVYVTKQLLADNRTDEISGRATRVWEAYREDDPERISVVIKDLWTSIGGVQEGAQLEELHEKLRALVDPGTPRPPSDYFLTLVDHGFVPVAGGADDNTVDVMMHGHHFSVGSANHSPRKHYRIVFKELGVAISGMDSISDVMRALADATRALSLLHRLGLVHRDVSAGNILLVDGVGKLSDLEYLKSYKGEAGLLPCDPDIGTPEYTAVEVANNRYMWGSDTLGARGKDSRAPRAPVPSLRFHPLHDIESTLWIALWFLLYHQRRDDAMNALLDAYFPPGVGGRALTSRRIGFRSEFLPEKSSDPFLAIVKLLNELREDLCLRYERFEGDFDAHYSIFDDVPLPKDSPFEAVHAEFIKQYDSAVLLADAVAFPGPEKRKAPDSPTSDTPPASESASDSDSVRRSKKQKSAKTSPSPLKNSPTRRMRDATFAGRRRSSRIAEKIERLGTRKNSG